MPTASGVRAGRRLAVRSRMASMGVILILLAASIFAIWSSWATAASAHRAATSNRLSDDFARAASAVAAEESLERKYRLEPGPDVLKRYDAAAADLVNALHTAGRDGLAEDQALVDKILALHTTYLAAVNRMFAAVDRHDTAAVLRYDAEGDRSFDTIEQMVTDEAGAEHGASLAALHRLQNLENVTSRLTPAVFIVGLILAALLASVIRAYRRALNTERARAVHDSLHDALTGLPNRVLLADRFEQALHAGKRTGATAGLLLIDLDRFKEVNDTFGHHYGDQLLVQVGPRLRAALRDSDTVARLGGDEFAVLLPDVSDLQAAHAVAEKALHTLEAPFVIEGVDLDVEASVGVVVSGEHGDDAATLLQRADIAMYVAKSQNLRVFAYNSDADGHSPARLALLGDLRRALERDEIVLHYQPKVSVSSGEVVGVEALVRWQHPTRGLIYPDAFIPVAEHSGLIGPLTYYIIDAALGQARRWIDMDRPLVMSVNLSARNLLDERLPAQVTRLLQSHQVPPGLLILEVTESAIMTEPRRARRLLQQLAELGIRISIDDFGAGYTSLGQLKTLPVSELKIDRSFVMRMGSDRSDALIVRSMVDLGHNLGLAIVAEGVEDAAALEDLASFGCDVAQGYHISRPVPAAAYDIWCAEQTLAPLPFTVQPAQADRDGTFVTSPAS